MYKAAIITMITGALMGLVYMSLDSSKDRPCLKIIQACEQAGLVRGNTPEERAQFFAQCLQPLMETGRIGDIVIDEKSAKACQRRISRRRNG